MTIQSRSSGESTSWNPSAATSGAAAVAETEQRICGQLPMQAAQVAEGLALLGARAASVGDNVADGATTGLSASCVHHVHDGPDGPDGPVLLAPSTVQEAVDICYVAHRLSGTLGAPVTCTLGPALGSALGHVTWPDDALTERLLNGTRAAADRSVEETRSLALACFAHVASGTGRLLEPVERHGAERTVLVAAGRWAAPSRALAEALRAEGVGVSALSLRLVRPFPAGAVKAALQGADRVVVVPPGPGQRGLAAEVRAALPVNVEVVELNPSGSNGDALRADLRRTVPSLGVTEVAGQPALRLLATPPGSWARRVVRELAATLAARASVDLDGAASEVTETGRWEGVYLRADGLRGELLVAPGLAHLDPEDTLGAVARGAAIVVADDASDETTFARALDDSQRAVIRARGLQVWWVAVEASGTIDSPADGPASTLASRLVAAASSALSGEEWPGLRRLDEAELDPERHRAEIDFGQQRPLPKLPERATPAVDATRQLRAQHFAPASEHAPAMPTVPLWIWALADELRSSRRYPLLVERRAGSGAEALEVIPFEDALDSAIHALGEAAGSGLRKYRGRLAREVRHAASRGAVGRSASEVIASVAESVAGAGGAAADELRAQALSLAGELRSARLIGLCADTPIALYAEAAAAHRAARFDAFRRDLSHIHQRLDDIEQLEERKSGAGHDPAALAASLGGMNLLDPSALARVVPSGGGSKRSSLERCARVRASAAAINAYLGAEVRGVFVTRPGALSIDPDTAALIDAEVVTHPRPLAAAVGIFEAVARRTTPIVRASRVGRLEVEDAYREDLHDEALGRLDWEGFTSSELAIVPTVTVVVDEAYVRGPGMGDFSKLLGSSRPVKVLVVGSTVARPDDPSAYHLDLGYLAMAHREAFVVQTTLARPERVVHQLARMVAAERPGVAIFGLPSMEPAPWRELRAEAALWGRAAPELAYDPDAGVSWAERLDLSDNPQPARLWPTRTVTCVDSSGGEQVLEIGVTWADIAALEPGLRDELVSVPATAWDDDHQEPLADHLQAHDAHGDMEATPDRLPFVWVMDASETVRRVMPTRSLTLACFGRQRAWRVLQELGGFDNAHARKAADTARSEAAAAYDAELAELTRSHADEVARVRHATASEALGRLASALLDVDVDGLAPSGARPTVVRSEVPKPASADEPKSGADVGAPTPVEAATAVEEVLVEEAYIDTPLCTSCNECTNLNGRLFVYDENKQALIGDLSAGTFAELVKAAELCPARCIHPGKPQTGDASATAKVVARAKALFE